MRRPAVPQFSRAAASAPRAPTEPADMHDAHLVNAIAKAEREGEADRLAKLRVEAKRRGL